MNQRVLGFVFVSVAVVAAILVFTFAQGYNVRAPLTWNLANAEAFSIYRTGTVTRSCPRPAPRFGLEFDSSVPLGCPNTVARWLATPSPTYQATGQTKVFSLSLGVGMAVITAVALAGVGLIAFGRK